MSEETCPKCNGLGVTFVDYLTLGTVAYTCSLCRGRRRIEVSSPKVRRPIVPEDERHTVSGYEPDHWDYPSRCADLDLALDATRERIEEWDKEGDPHGWWHERPLLIALYNAAVGAT